MIGGNMSKKQIYIILSTIVFFVIIITIILLPKKKSNWQKEILSANNIQVFMEDCNDRKTELPKETVEVLFSKFNDLIDNGPWTGDEKKCYDTLTITYEKESVIQSINIYITSDSSLVLNINDNKRYYVNSMEANAYLKNLLKIY